MLKRREKLMTKLLILTMFISLVPTTIAFAASDGSGVVVTNVTTSTNTTTSTDVKVTGITISGSDTITTYEGTLTLTSNISPSNATNSTVTWSCSDTSVANVSSAGVVTAIVNGSVTITATANDGSGIKGSKVITVSGQTTTIKSVYISGTEEVGHKLTAKVSYIGTEPSLGYQWQRANKKDGTYSNISGADEEEYKLKSSDNNKYVKLVVTATIDGQVYTDEDITSRIDSDDDDDDDDTITNSSKDNSENVIQPTRYNSNSPNDGGFTNPSGMILSGWIYSNGGKWYYLDRNGVAQTGWISANGNWYYLSNEEGPNRGVMQTGWIYESGKWYCLDSSGALV